MTLDTLIYDAEQANARLSAVHQRLAFEQQHTAGIRRKLDTLEQQKAKLVKAIALIDRAIEVISASGVGTIQSVVTEGLQLAFEDPRLQFLVVKSEGKRGNSYSLEGRRGQVQGPLDETFGGGISNVAGFLLRVIMIKRFRLAKVLVLDEQFNNVSPNFLPKLSFRLLRDLTHNHGFTIFAITQQKVLAVAADHVYRVVPVTDGSPILHKLSEDEKIGLLDQEDWLTGEENEGERELPDYLAPGRSPGDPAGP